MEINKVTTEITKDGWITTVVYNGETITEKYEYIDGVLVCVEGCFDNAGLPKNLLDEVCKLTEYNVLYELRKLYEL